jgi:hypothetical protein
LRYSSNATTAGAIAVVSAAVKGIYDLADAARVVDNRNGTNTREQINDAHQAVRRLGAESMDLAAVTAGGGLGRSWLGKFVETVTFNYGVNGAPPAYHWLHDAAHVFTHGDFGSQLYRALPYTGLLVPYKRISSAIVSEYNFLTNNDSLRRIER